MDSLLAELHRAMVTQACLSNTTAILSLHLWHLARQLQASPGDPESAGELVAASSHISSLMKEQTIATGCSLDSFWMARHHLWLSQSWLWQDNRDYLMRQPVDPTAIFRPVATQLLQQATDNRHAAQEMSRGLHRHSARVGRP